MSDELGCPECRCRTFELKVTGLQEKASFTPGDDGPTVQQAGSVTVNDHDEGSLNCEGCPAVVEEDELVPVEGES
jgi:hypothetical protein